MKLTPTPVNMHWQDLQRICSKPLRCATPTALALVCIKSVDLDSIAVGGVDIDEWGVSVCDSNLAFQVPTVRVISPNFEWLIGMPQSICTLISES